MLIPHVAALLLAAAAAPADLAIEHSPASCVLADVFPKLTACVTANAEIGAPRLYFRGQGDRRWYYVEMAWDGACFAGVLPKPLRGLRALDYYIAVQAVTPPFAQAQSRVYSPGIKPAAQGCSTPFLADAKLRATPTEGDLRVPTGFARDGLQGLPQPARRIGGGAVVIGAGVAAATTLAAGTAIVAASGDATPTAAPAATSSPTPVPEPTERVPTPAPTVGPAPATPEPTAPPPPPPSTTLPPLPTTLPIPTLPLAPTQNAREDDTRVPARTFAVVSSLDAAGARGQLVLNGREAWMPAAGTSRLNGVARPGTNRLELYVVQTRGEGTWRIEILRDTPIRPASWRAVAGDIVRFEDRAVIVRVRGRDQRAVVSFELD